MTSRKLQLILVFATLLFLCAFQPQSNQVIEIQWVDVIKIDSLMAVNPKPILLDIRADWCGMCKKLDETTLKDEAVVNYLNEKFYAIHFNFHDKRSFTFKGIEYSDTGKFHALAKHFDASGLPTLVFLDDSMQVVHNIQGYRNKKEFMHLLYELTGGVSK